MPIKKQGIMERHVYYDIDSFSNVISEVVLTDPQYKDFINQKNGRNLEKRCWNIITLESNPFIILKLNGPSIVNGIKFYIQNKFGNFTMIKQFKLFCSDDKKNWNFLYGGQLDIQKKAAKKVVIMFTKQDENQSCYPVKYIKFVPVSGHSKNSKIHLFPFLFLGSSNSKEISIYTQNKINKDLVKQQRYAINCLRTPKTIDQYDIILNAFPNLEPLFIDEVFNNTVKSLDFLMLERIMTRFFDSKAFDSLMDNLSYYCKWTNIHGNFTTEELYRNGLPSHPINRGGQSMCIDISGRSIYLFGGWSGTRDLSDFWSYSLVNKCWKILSVNTETEGGPPGKSCHQMCISEKNKKIYLLGCFTDYASEESFFNDFYEYDILTNKWTCLSPNTSAENGPKLIYSHQMVYNDNNDEIYVFGGNILTSSFYNVECEKFHIYDVKTNLWNRNISKNQKREIKSITNRSDHAMVFDTEASNLIIFPGVKKRVYINELNIVNTKNWKNNIVSDEYIKPKSHPMFSYTIRSSFDVDLKEVFLFTGLSRKNPNEIGYPVSNKIYVYEINKNKWTQVYKNSYRRVNYNKDWMPDKRFAFSVVYDPIEKVNYMFGGNPGVNGDKEERFNDFWKLKICKPTRNEIIDIIKYILCLETYYLNFSTETLSTLMFFKESREKIRMKNHIKVSDMNETLEKLLSEMDYKQPGNKEKTREQFDILNKILETNEKLNFVDEDVYDYIKKEIELHIGYIPEFDENNSKEICQRYRLFKKLSYFFKYEEVSD